MSNTRFEELEECVRNLRGRANDADCWADSYAGQRQEGWLRSFARVMRDAAAIIERRS